MKILIVFLGIAIFPFVNGKKCKADPSPVGAHGIFSASEFSGDWYDLMMSGLKVDSKQCAKRNINVGTVEHPSPSFYRHVYSSPGSTKFSSSSGSLTFTTNQGTLKFNGGPEYRIVATDYDTYAVLWSCYSHVLFWTREETWVLVRDGNQNNPNVITAVNDYLKTINRTIDDSFGRFSTYCISGSFPAESTLV